MPVRFVKSLEQENEDEDGGHDSGGGGWRQVCRRGGPRGRFVMCMNMNTKFHKVIGYDDYTHARRKLTWRERIEFTLRQDANFRQKLREC